MTTRQSLRADYVAIALGAVSLALIIAALGFQYLGGRLPCEMCHWQRWPHIAAALVGILGGGFGPRRLGVPVVMVTILLVATSGLIALWHTGVQYHILPGPIACTVVHPFVIGAPPVPPSLFQTLFTGYGAGANCNVPVYVLGLVFPAWNAIISFLAAGAAIMMLGKGDGEKA